MLLCPKCGKKSEVIDSRLNVDYNAVRRRRRCKICGYRFTTYESIEFEKPKRIRKEKIEQPEITPEEKKIYEKVAKIERQEEKEFEDWDDEEDWVDVY